MRKFYIEVTYPVTVIINDENVIDRVIQNMDDEGVPQPFRSGKGWRDRLYNLEDDEEVIQHLAYNFTHGRDIQQLDGWADTSDDAVDCSIGYPEYSLFEEDSE